MTTVTTHLTVAWRKYEEGQHDCVDDLSYSKSTVNNGSKSTNGIFLATGTTRNSACKKMNGFVLFPVYFYFRSTVSHLRNITVAVSITLNKHRHCRRN